MAYNKTAISLKLRLLSEEEGVGGKRTTKSTLVSNLKPEAEAAACGEVAEAIESLLLNPVTERRLVAEARLSKDN